MALYEVLSLVARRWLFDWIHVFRPDGRFSVNSGENPKAKVGLITLSGT